MAERLGIGVRVRIVGRDHPWHRESGVIVAVFGKQGLDWTVQLDRGEYSGHEVAAASHELRRED